MSHHRAAHGYKMFETLHEGCVEEKKRAGNPRGITQLTHKFGLAVFEKGRLIQMMCDRILT